MKSSADSHPGADELVEAGRRGGEARLLEERGQGQRRLRKSFSKVDQREIECGQVTACGDATSPQDLELWGRRPADQAHVVARTELVVAHLLERASLALLVPPGVERPLEGAVVDPGEDLVAQRQSLSEQAVVELLEALTPGTGPGGKIEPEEGQRAIDHAAEAAVS